jgi:hypothetical protein
MSEDLSQAVPAATVSDEAVPPVRAIDSEDPALLKNKIELAKADREKAIAEKQSYKKQVEDLTRKMAEWQSSQQQAKQAAAIEKEDYKSLWNESTGTISSLQDKVAQLEQKLQEKDVAFQQQQIKAAALNAISQSGVVNPEQAFSLMQENLRLDEKGNTVVLAGGVQVDLASHMNSLKQPGSGWEHHFVGSGARGMSAAGSSIATGGGQSWSSMSAFERMTVEAMDEQNGTNNAARLKAAG